MERVLKVISLLIIGAGGLAGAYVVQYQTDSEYRSIAAVYCLIPGLVAILAACFVKGTSSNE